MAVSKLNTTIISVADDRQMRKGGYSETQEQIGNILGDIFEWGTYRYGIHGKEWMAEQIEKHPILKSIDAGINGRAYKPLAISQTLNTIADGSFLIYTDCSPEMWLTVQDTVYSLDVIHNLTIQNSDILTAFVKWDYQNIPSKGLGMHIHKYFTTDLCIDTMGLRQYENSFQHASGMMCIRKTPETVKFVEEWLYWNLNPKCASLGSIESGTDEYWQAESDRKIGHRHDQSISGLLLNARNAKFVDILHNDMNPYNFLQFCRVGQEYKFINSNTPVEPRMDMNKVFIRVGSHVRNEADILLKVYGVNGNEIKVGQFEESCWIEDRGKLKLV